MATYTQIPAELDIEVGAGDDLSILLDFDISLTGYTFVSKVVQAYSGTETTVTCTNTDLANGQVTISLTDTQITSIGVSVIEALIAETFAREMETGTLFSVKSISVSATIALTGIEEIEAMISAASTS